MSRSPNLRISSLTREYVKVPTRAFAAGQPVNITDNSVRIAFTAIDEQGQAVEPEESDWNEADWEAWPGEFYLARCLVGPGSDTVLADGTYNVWINVDTSQENVVRLLDGKLVVT